MPRPIPRLLAALLVAAVAAATPAPVGAQTNMATSFKGFGAADNKEPIQIEADRAEVRDKENTVVFIGNVKVRQGESTLQTHRLTVVYEGKALQTMQQATAKPAAGGGGGGPSTSQIRSLLAEGKVIIANKDQTATGDRGTFDMRIEQAVLTGEVILIQGKNVGRGRQLTVDMKTGQAKLEGGRVQFLLVPGQETPGAETKPAAKDGKERPKEAAKDTAKDAEKKRN